MSEKTRGSMAHYESAVRVDASQCKGCGQCVDACPVDVLRLDADKGKAVVEFPMDCCVCYLCMDDCPTGAVTVDHNRKSPRLFSIYDQLGIKLPDWAE